MIFFSSVEIFQNIFKNDAEKDRMNYVWSSFEKMRE